MDEETKTITLGPRSRKANIGDEDLNCDVTKKIQDAPTGAGHRQANSLHAEPSEEIQNINNAW